MKMVNLCSKEAYELLETNRRKYEGKKGNRITRIRLKDRMKVN